MALKGIFQAGFQGKALWFVFSFVCGMGLFAATVSAQPASAGKTEFVRASLHSEQLSVRPGETVWVALQLKVREHMYVYWMNPGDSSAAMSVDWELPEGITAGEIHYPVPQWKSVQGLISYIFKDELIVLIPLHIADSVKAGSYSLKADAGWFVCDDDGCYSEDDQLSLVLAVGEPRTNEEAVQLFERARLRMPPEEVLKEVRFEVTDNTPRLIFPASLLDGAHHVPDYMPPETVATFFPAESIISPQSIQAPKVSGEKAVFEMAWELGGERATKLEGLLLVGIPSERFPFTVYPIRAERQGEQAAPVSTSQASAALTSQTSTQVSTWDESRFSELPGLGTTLGYVSLDGGSAEITGIGMALGLAFLGGLILNIMPCVFPVLGLKVMGFIKQAGGDARKIRLHGLVFTAGVVVSFWVLTTALLILRSTLDSSLGWGFQMQDPFFISLVVLLFFFFGLSLVGVFEFGGSLMSVGGKTQSKDGYLGSFFSGAFATIVATPCVGPFLGPVLGFTLTLQGYETILIFTVMALGLASPYLLSSFFPKMLALFPRPGAWMETFKQLLAFPMFAAAIYFLWSFGKQTGNPDNLIQFGVAMLLTGTAAWIWGKWAIPSKRKSVRRTGVVCALILLSGSVFVAWKASRPDEQFLELLSKAEASQAREEGWIPFSPERLLQARAEGRPVYVDFTAAWCLICKANKLSAFEGPGSDEVWKQARAQNIVMMVADWTSKDSMIAHYLQSFGRAGVPLNVIYPADPDQQPIVMPSLLTPEIVLEGFSKVAR